ncbi:MAG: Mth938-like domain-containing protein, partial [Rickettsiales bacterium]|nr:Mth938-like domain-containing protein [Rickettsiales bacterium]
QTFPPKPMLEMLRAAGLVVEVMDTGAACRTYNVLLAEERAVMAALIAV